MKSQIKTSTQLLAMSLMVCLSACSKSDGNKETSTVKSLVREVQDLSVDNNFKSQGSYDELVKQGSEKSTDKYSIGCGDADFHKYDPTTRVGEKVMSKTLSSGASGHVETITSETILSLVGLKSEIQRDILSISVAELGGEILESKIQFKEKCDIVTVKDGDKETTSEKCLSDENLDYESHFKKIAIDYINNNQQALDVRCRLENVKESISQDEIGTYNLISGETVKAYRAMTTAKGDVLCTSKGVEENLGEGEETWYNIRSNEAHPGTSRYFCGGATLVSGQSIKLKGKVIDSYRNENFLSKR